VLNFATMSATFKTIEFATKERKEHREIAFYAVFALSCGHSARTS